MSKRFGRNQRRRMREQLAALEAANSYEREVSARGRAELRAAITAIEDAERIAGRYSVAFGAKRLMVGGKAGPYVDIMPPVDLGPLWDPHDPNPNEPPMMRIVRLPVLLTAVTECMREQDAYHAYVQFDGACVGYAISRRALLTMRPDDAIARMSSEIAKQLVRTLREAGVPFPRQRMK